LSNDDLLCEPHVEVTSGVSILCMWCTNLGEVGKRHRHHFGDVVLARMYKVNVEAGQCIMELLVSTLQQFFD